jgi:caffeoyl-CoA O-methyltransferase
MHSQRRRSIAHARIIKIEMITDPKIERYMYDLLPTRDSVLAEMEEYAEHHNIPIVGPAVGRFLTALVMMTKARRIFELGSAIGYSTIWLARAAGQGAEVHYSDGSAERAERARGYFERAGVADRIQVHIGNALSALQQVPGEFDFIFNDVDKDGYPAVLEAVPARIRRGGLFVTDNTLWHARVLDPHEDTDHAVRLFNERLFASPFFYTTQMPLRDGVSVAIRL